MPPRKRKAPEKANDENAEDSPVETPKKNDKADRKRKALKKKSNEVETVTSPTQATEKHVVVKILLNAQTNEAFHNKYIKELTNQYEKIGHNEFLAMFICCLKQLIEKEEAVALYANVGLQFMAKFAASLTDDSGDDMHRFLEAVFDWVLKTVSLSHNVRARLCKFVNVLLDSLGSNAMVDDNLFDNILKYMFDRLKDLYPSVRVQAIKALQRLQMPDDPDDPIVKIYTFHLASDPSGPVRQAVLTCLGRNIHTIPVILERLWDIDEKVRRHVYVHMANYPVKTYKVIHRLTFLEQGLNDRNDSVRKIVTGIMIPQWLESYGKNYLAFLSGLKLDANDAEIDRFRAIARLALSEIFKTQNPEELIATLCLDEDENSPYPKCIPFEKLTVESSLFWCSLIAFFQQDERRSDYLESVVPELSIFCGYVEKYNDTTVGEEKEPWEVTISQSILFNLIEILINFDYGDEIGRQRLRSLAIHLLTTNPCNEQIIVSLIKILEKLVPSSDDRLQVLHDIIRSLVDQDLVEKSFNSMDPNVVEAMEKDPNLKVQVSSLKLKLYELKEEQSKFVKAKDYASVSRIADEVTQCQDRLVTLIRPFMSSGSNTPQPKRITKEQQVKALKLAFHGVCSKHVSKLNPAMCQLYTDFIRLKIESSEVEVRNWALKCGATFSLLYEQLAKDVFTALNKQFFDHHHTEVWTTSVSAMFQLIDRYGFSYFDEDPNGDAEPKQKDKPKKSRLLYNTTEYTEDPENDSNVENGNVTIKGLIYLFGHFMDTCDDIHLMSALIDGFGLLILHGLYVDEKLVSRLILLYFNPNTEPEVNQILSIFFETLIHQKKQQCLETALIQTLTKIIEASNESPLHEVKIETVLRFIISSTMPVYCKAGAKIHDNIALSLLKWMKTNETNREVLKITSKEILSLDISDDNAVRQTAQEHVDELLKLAMDSKTEKNLKSFNEKMKGNCPADIQFSSVAPATTADGEIEIDETENEDPAQSDNDSSNRNDDGDENSEVAVEAADKDDDGGETSKRDEASEDDQSESNDTSNVDPPESSGNATRTSNGTKRMSTENPAAEAAAAGRRTATRASNGKTQAPTGDSIAENEETAGRRSDTRPSDGRKRLPTEDSNADNVSTPGRESTNDVASPAVEPYYTSNEESQDETLPEQLVLQAVVHAVPVNREEAVPASLSKMRKRVLELLSEQQQTESPDIQPAPIQKVASSKSSAASVSEPKKNLKRKSDTLKSGEDDAEDAQPEKKKSRREIGKEITPKSDKGKGKKTTTSDQEQPSRPPPHTERLTRRSRTTDDKNSATKKTSKTNARNAESKTTPKVLPKRTASNLPIRTKNQVDATKKTTVQKKAVQSDSAKVSAKKSDTQPPSRSGRRSRTMSFNVEDATPTKKPIATVNKKSARLIASEPPAPKTKSKTGPKKSAAASKIEKVKSSRSSLSNLDDARSILDTSQHRTRRALAKEFLVNNVVTRNRSSIDGVTLLQKLPTTRRKSVGTNLIEKPSTSAKKAAVTTSVTSRLPRRIRDKK